MLVRWSWSCEGNVSRSIASKWGDSHAPPGMVVGRIGGVEVIAQDAQSVAIPTCRSALVALMPV
jgi:hypothetical protein